MSSAAPLPQQEAPKPAKFGTQFADNMAIIYFKDGAWTNPEIVPTGPIPMHPASHVLHYGSACFEGLKAFRTANGKVQLFRLDSHVDRMRDSARLLCLPTPERAELHALILDIVRREQQQTPDFPGSLYIRPTLIGTEPNIGAASAPSADACLFVLLSPVGDYFSGGLRPLKLYVEEERMRSTPHFGQAKTGANYAQALILVEEANAKHGVDQVLFAPGGDVQETGASNFLLINDEELVTKPLDGSFLSGVTRDSLLQLAQAMGYRVSERNFTVDEMLQWTKNGEAALSGTAAVLSPVGSLICRGETHAVGDGENGKNTLRLRDALLDIQSGRAQSGFDWLTPV